MYAGRFLRLVPERIHDPATHRRPADDSRQPAVEIADRHFMAVMAGVHGPNHGHIIDDPGDVRQQLGYLGAGTAMFCKLPRTAEQPLCSPD